ncbi:MAG: response regulator [Gammaproteobacteria bacterium]|nr:response regulator [Gammaproteobacteria bacterium]
MSELWLIIDDDPSFAATLSRRLKHKGYECEIALDGYDALRLCKSNIFDYLIVDLNLNNENGLELVPELRSILPNAKILMLTGYASIATAVQAIKLGADHYLPKPASLNQILQVFETEPVANELSINSPMSPEQLEWEHIQFTLQQNQGNISATARALDMHRRTLQRKLNKRPGKKRPL